MRIKKRTISVLFLLFSIVNLQYSTTFYKLDRLAMDTVYQQEQGINNNIKLIKIDEAALIEYGAFGTWDRQIYADLITIISSEGDPYFIGFDILFSGSISEEGDQNFADACEEHGNVGVVNTIVFEEDITYAEDSITIDNMHINQIEEPFNELLSVTSQGFSNAIIDTDGVIRESLYSVNYEGSNYYSFSQLVAQNIAELQGTELVDPESDSVGIFGFNYSGVSHAYEEISLTDVLNGNVDPAVFKDTIVLVGAHAAGLQDAYGTSIDSSQLMYGVEININIAEAIVNQSTYLDIDENIFKVILVFATILICFILAKFKVIPSAILLVLFNVGYFFIAIYAHNKGLEIPLIMIPSVSVLMYVVHVLSNYFITRKKQKETEQLFKTYVSPQVVENVIHNKGALELTSEVSSCAILFMDIRNFTSISEVLTPPEVVDFLNKYFELSTEVIFRNEGTIDKFIGDAVMVVFNSPFEIEDYIYKAVKTAMELRKECIYLQQYVKEKYDKELSVGIGINCGNVIAGNIGTKKRLDFTVIGDNVNVAARLESNAKGGQILVSESVKNAVENRFEFETLGAISLKGKQEKVEVYNVLKERGRTNE